MRSLLLLVIGVLLAGSYPSQGTPLLLDPEKECTQVWRKKGFSTEKAFPQNSLFDVTSQEKYDDFYKRVTRADCWKEWLVIVYMAADNDLSPFSFRDIWEMEGVGSVPSADVVVFHDNYDEDGARYFHIAKRKQPYDYKKELEKFVKENGLESESDPKVREEAFLKATGKFVGGKSKLVVSPILKETSESDSGSLPVAGEFLRWAFDKFPSRRLMIVGWSHGEGFDAKEDAAARALRAARANSPGSGRQGGFAFDFTSKSHMAVNQLAAGVKTVLGELREGKSIDILGSDACLNQQMEFGYEWLGIADYVFGSSTIVQKKGFNYSQLLSWFERSPKAETGVLAKEIPEIYGRSVKKSSTGVNSSYYDPDATMATWAMGSIQSASRSMNDLAKLLTGWVQASKDQIEKIDRLQAIKGVIKKTQRLGGVSNDLWNFLQHLEEWVLEEREKANIGDKDFWNDLRKEISTCTRNLKFSVVGTYIGENYQSGLLKTSLGVSVWFPLSKVEYKEMLPKFQKGKFYQSEEDPKKLSDWGEMIRVLYAATEGE